MNGSLGIVLMCIRIAEIDERAVPSIPFDAAAELLHRATDGAAIGNEDVPVVLRIEFIRQYGRSHKIAKHEGDLAALDGFLGSDPADITCTAFRAEPGVAQARLAAASASGSRRLPQRRRAITPDCRQCAAAPGALHENSARTAPAT